MTLCLCVQKHNQFPETFRLSPVQLVCLNAIYRPSVVVLTLKLWFQSHMFNVPFQSDQCSHFSRHACLNILWELWFVVTLYLFCFYFGSVLFVDKTCFQLSYYVANYMRSFSDLWKMEPHVMPVYIETKSQVASSSLDTQTPWLPNLKIEHL